MATMNPPGHGGKKGIPQLPAVRSKSMMGMHTKDNLWGTHSASLRNATLRPLTPDHIAEGGAPQAWQPGIDPKTQNIALRRELAHVTRIRDNLRQTRSQLPAPQGGGHFNVRGDQHEEHEPIDGNAAGEWAGEGRGPTRGGGGVSRGRFVPSRGGGPLSVGGIDVHQIDGARIKTGTAAASKVATAAGSKLATAAGSKLATAAGSKAVTRVPTRRQTAASSRSMSRAGTATGPYITPEGGTGRTPLHVIRPDTQFMKSFMERQPKVGMCLLWSVGPKRMEMFEEKMKKDLADPAKQAAKKRKQLLAAMRRKLQNTLVNTQTLATDLWKLYRESDSDRSGRIEFDEFCEIMDGVGLGLNVLGHTSMAMLFQLADKDGGGSVDFSEFLSAVVGNIVSV